MLDLINKLIWVVASSLIIISSFYFTFKFKFIQFNCRQLFKSLFSGGSNNMKTLMFVLSGRAGVGSIAGVALGIYLGGPGAIFWMWLMGVFGAVLTFIETVLSNMYKVRDDDNLYRGGPSYYLYKAMSKHKLSILYAIVLLCCYVGGIVGIQANTITVSFEGLLGLNKVVIGIFLCLITSLIIFGKISKLIRVSSYIVPIMTLIYIGSALYIIIINLPEIPLVFSTIVEKAFVSKSVIGGLIPTLVIGIQRGIFSNEAGLGTGAVLSATSNSKDPIAQGYVQVIGVYMTTLLICTASAIIIMTANLDLGALGNINGIEIIQNAFYFHYGNFGLIIIVISIFLFSFTSILTGYYYGESSFKYLFKKVGLRKNVFLKTILLFNIFVGSVASPMVLWKSVDIFIALLAIINIYAIYNLYHLVQKELDKRKET